MKWVNKEENREIEDKLILIINKISKLYNMKRSKKELIIKLNVLTINISINVSERNVYGVNVIE